MDRTELMLLGGGVNPVGTIITFMGTTAPEGYLVCDGTVYNITDYPLLANHFETQFETKNHFGGNGTTTFAVPDLRGEFLRGTGTNSHVNQGSGGSVGEHQDGTEHVLIQKYEADLQTKNAQVYIDKKDSDIGSYNTSYANFRQTATGTSGGGNASPKYTSRPTNTSVLWCIKY